MAVQELAAAVGAVAVFVGAVVSLWRWSKLGELVKGIRLFLADWFGEPERPGRPELPSFPARMARVEDRAACLAQKLGDDVTAKLTALAYTVDRVHDQGSTSAERLAQLDARVSDHRRRNDEQVALLREAVARNAAALDDVKRRGEQRRAGDPPGVDPLSTED